MFDNELQYLNLIVVLVRRLGGSVEVSGQELFDNEHASIKSQQTVDGVRLTAYDIR